MRDKKLRWNRVLPVMMAASMLMQNCFVVSAEGTEQQAEIQAEVQALKSLTSAELETGGMSAATARLKIGDWLDYGDYGIEREDVPGTTYHFYISTKDEAGNVINDQQMAYCIQSYFLTPLPGDHTEDMTDNVLSICGGTNVQKSLYYGYGGVGYNEEEFDTFLQKADPEYYENVYTYLSDNEKEELAYILTHGAASYAYFTDGTDLEEYYKLQFKIKYGDDGERQYGYFKEQELKKAGITADDMNLLGATYGMNPTGIALAREWYDVIAAKTDPWLEMVEADGVYTFQGNEENEELSLGFVVPEDWNCIMTGEDGTEEVLEAGEEIVLSPLEEVVFSYVGEAFSAEENGLTDTVTVVNGTLTGAEKEVWSLVLLETNKGNEQSVSKRQQDIAAISMIDSGRKDMDFELQPEKGSFTIIHKDDLGNPIAGAEIGVYFDETYSNPVLVNGEPLILKTDESGTAYMEFLFNEQLKDENSAFYFKTLTLPEGYEAYDFVSWCRPDAEEMQLINNTTKTLAEGTLDWNVPEGTELPDAVEAALMLNGEQIGTVTVTAEDGWKYVFDDLQAYVTDAEGKKIPAEYTVEILPVDGFVTVLEDGQMILTVPTPGTAVIEGTVSMSGRELKAGDFSFSLVQVTDASAAEELSGGFSGTAENKEDGTFAFDELVFTEAGVYYYKFTSEDGQTYIVQADVAAGGEFGELLEVTLTWMDQDGNVLEDGISAMTFAKEYHASGGWQMNATVELENAELKEGQFTVEMKDEQGVLLQVQSNDAEGHIVFDPITYTEENIGETYMYTFAQQTAGDEESPIIYDTSECEVEIQVADSADSDGSLEITVTSAGVFWINTFAGSGGMVLKDTDGQPVAGAKVRLYTESENGEKVPYLSEEDSLYVSDENGEVAAENLPEGNYIFVVEEMPEGYAEVGAEYPFYVGTDKNEVDTGYTGRSEFEITVEKETEVQTETETEAVTEVQTETETEAATEVQTETETEAATEVQTETETEAATEVQTETETEVATEVQTETETEAATEVQTEAETEAVTEAPAETKAPTWSLWSIIVLIIMIILYLIRRRRNR